MQHNQTMNIENAVLLADYLSQMWQNKKNCTHIVSDLNNTTFETHYIHTMNNLITCKEIGNML